jgi:hypothetical protein
MFTPREQENNFCSATLHNIADSDYDKFMIGKPSYTPEELRTKVPKEYHNEIEVFMKKEADIFPPHRPVDHEILLEEGKTPSFMRSYKHVYPRTRCCQEIYR